MCGQNKRDNVSVDSWNTWRFILLLTDEEVFTITDGG